MTAFHAIDDRYPARSVDVVRSAASGSIKTVLEALATTEVSHSALPSKTGQANADMPLRDRLEAATTYAKVQARRNAALFEPEWMDRFISQIDALFDAEEWDPADEPVSNESIDTLIRLLILCRNIKRPSLGVARGGYAVANWSAGRENQLTVECRGHDVVRYIISRNHRGAQDRVAGVVALRRLLSLLAPFDINEWLAHEARPHPG